MAAEVRQKGSWLWTINPLAILLWPISLLFCVLVFIRRQFYRWQWLTSHSVGKPVVVVGNISIGGNGKTPVVHGLVKLLQANDLSPGILTRGYRSDVEAETVILNDGNTSFKAGDEANMLSELCACPIAVGADRVSTASQLLKKYPHLDLLIADDGLQHYALQRDVEIIVKRDRAMGNGFCLPAGPLREPGYRLQQCDLLIDRDSSDVMEKLGPCWNLKNPEMVRELESFRGLSVHALAGIGFPQAFFQALAEQGINVQPHPYPDHHVFTKGDIKAYNDAPLLVTHKDAVKIRPFASPDIWVVPLELTLSNELQHQIMTILEPKLDG